MNFADHTQQILERVETYYKPLKEVDAITFLTSSEYQNEDLLPVQRVIIKTFYNLWTIYPPDVEEQKILNILKKEWNIKIDFNRVDPVLFLILILGRRSTKSTTISFIAGYEAYSLICKDNPQKYYGLRDRHPIHIIHIAAAGDQAEDVFTLTKNNIRKVSFFRPYIDFDKDSSTELRLFTPYDIRLNEQIKFKNSLIHRGSGIQKESTLPGSITIESVTTSAATHRGKAIKVLMLSEFAHFERAKIGGSKEDVIFGENPKTDYAIWKAFTPSVKDFGKDGKVLLETSPREKGGEAYNQYCIAGGVEQDNYESASSDPSYQLIQLSTWQSRIGEDNYKYENFLSEFRKDPIGANMEYGAHFGNPAGSFIQEEWINRVPVPMVTSLRSNPKLHKFVITLDPGGKAKKKQADTYAIAWGHSEGTLHGKYENEENILYYIDGLKGFDAKIVFQGNTTTQIPVNPNDVMDFILNLIDQLGGRQYIAEICYDQFDSSSPVAILQNLGLPAIETTFTNAYKSAMYGNYIQKLISNQVRMYGVDEEGWIERWKLENKYLQRITQGNYTFYQHPNFGPVQHDDFADVTANLIHRLSLLVAPTRQFIIDSRRTLRYPIQIKRGPKPVKAGSLLHTNNTFLT